MVPLDLAFSLDVCQQLIWEKHSQWLLIISEPDIQNVCGVCDRHESFAQAGTRTVPKRLFVLLMKKGRNEELRAEYFREMTTE